MTVINFNGPKTTQPVPAEGPINVQLTRTTFFTRWPCKVCGGCTEQVDVLAEGHGVRVCESCLRDGDIDGRRMQNKLAAWSADCGRRPTRLGWRKWTSVKRSTAAAPSRNCRPVATKIGGGRRQTTSLSNRRELNARPLLPGATPPAR
jgi:hypothetical protein